MASAWVQQQEEYILEHGIPLNEDQQIDAYQIGVKDITKVRIWYTDEVPSPQLPELKAAAEWAGLMSAGTLGTAFRYGIFIQSDFRDVRRLIAHELTHTMQYERLGSIDAFLAQYLGECFSVGYAQSPLEREAIEMEKKFV